MEETMERISALSARPLSTSTAAPSTAVAAPLSVKLLGTLLLIIIACLVYFLGFYDSSGGEGDSVGFIGGVNLQPSYYNGGNVTMGWETMKNFTEIQAVRIEIEPDMVEQGREWIRQASEQGYQMIVTYHNKSALGSDDSAELQAAAEWWRVNYQSLSQAGTFEVNLMNEWGSHDITATTYADAYNTAIPVVRTVYLGPLIVDIPGWGQETDTAIFASPLITDSNVVFSVHLYPDAYNKVAGRALIPEDMKNLFLHSDRPCIVGEFGDIQPDPVDQCDVKATVEAAKGVGFQAVYGWAWNGDGGTLNMVSPAWSSNPVAVEYTVTNYFWPILDLLRPPEVVPSVVPSLQPTNLVAMGGVNIQPSYYNNGNVTVGWETMNNFSAIKAVRIKITPDKVEQGGEWIRQACEQGYHTMLTFQNDTGKGSDDASVLIAAAKWWQTNYYNLSLFGSFDVNLMNEWGTHAVTSTEYADAYNAAIAIVRTVYSGPLVVDIPGWGQATGTAIAASPFISDQNIVFSTHLHPQSYNEVAGRYMNSEDVENLINQTDRLCIVGEFGNIQPDPVGADECDVKHVVEAAKAAGFEALYGWAWNGDGGSLNMVNPAWSSDPVAAEYSVTDYFWTIMELL